VTAPAEVEWTRDPLGLRADAPLLDFWLAGTGGPPRAAMGIPGHKFRQPAGDVTASDYPMYAGTGDAAARAAVLGDAEQRAADLWHAGWCRFSTGGASHGVLTLALAAGRPGQKIVVSRAVHRSFLAGLALAGLVPVWLRPRTDGHTGLPLPPAAAQVAAALAAHPDACAVFLTDPLYTGGTGDVEGWAGAAHAAGVPLLIDAAWGAHFGFHEAYPPGPLAEGADGVVTSIHKQLTGYTQAAVVYAGPGPLLDRARLDQAFDATHTSSPAAQILASIDAARALLASRGHELLGRTAAAVTRARQALASSVIGVIVPAGPLVDPARLVACLAWTGAHGWQVEADLIAAGMPPELADRDTLTATVTLADDPAAVAAFTRAAVVSIRAHRGPGRNPVPAAYWTVEPQMMLTPREAFFAPARAVPAAAAAGRVCGELIGQYPPGIPVIAPGELITGAALDALAEVRAAGGGIAAADPTLATVRVIDTGREETL
jgi:arginine decarboxylase